MLTSRSLLCQLRTVVALLLIVCPFSDCRSQGLAKEVDVKVITNQPVRDVFLDARGLVYALPLAEPEVLLRYDGNQVVRLGNAGNGGDGLDLPAGFEHSKLLKLKDNQLLSVSNPTSQVALIELEDLSLTIWTFEQLGLKDQVLSLSLAQDEQYWLSIAEGDAGLRFFEWDTLGVSRSFTFSVNGKVRDAKQVEIGDTLLIDVYPRGAFYYDWSGKLIKQIGDDDFSGWEMWESRRSYKYFSELKWLPDGRLYASLRWSYPSYYVFDRQRAKFIPAAHDFPDFPSTYVSVPTQDAFGNRLFAKGNYYGQRKFYLETAAGERYDLAEKLQDAVLGNRDHTNPQSVVTDDLGKGLWVASERRGLLRINFPENRINYWGRIFGIPQPLKLSGTEAIVNTTQNGILRMAYRGNQEVTGKHLFYEHRKKVIKGANSLAWDENGWLWANDYTALMGTNLATNDYREIELRGKIGRVWGLTSANRAIVGMADDKMLLIDLSTRAITDLNIPAIAKGTGLLSVYYEPGGSTWLGTEAGLFYGKPDDPEGWQKVETEFDDVLQVHHFYPEEGGRWWLASDQGWLSFDAGERKISKAYTTADGLAGDQVRSTVKAKGFYWIGTRSGLSRFHPATEEFRNFSSEEGLSSRKFTAGATYLEAANTVLFGTDDGLNFFSPEALMDDDEPSISVSSLSYFNEQEGKVVTIVGNPQEVTSISLPASNRSLEIEFFLNDPAYAHQHEFAYRLIGRDTEWISTKNLNRLSSRALPAGVLTLEIKGKTRFSDWSEPHRIRLQVAAFFYNTWWFRTGAVVLLLGLVSIWIYRLRQEKEKLELTVRERTATIRSDKETIEQQAEELQQLDLAKTRFFTNISHELRTPLTVIRGFATESQRNKEALSKTQLLASMGVIKSNSDRLLLLVNQLLELGKLEAGKLLAYYQRMDVRPELDLIVASFEAVAKEHKLHLRSSFAFSELAADLDRDKFLKILYNLLSNATKFTLAGGQIFIKAELTQADQLKVEVVDTGIGIAANQLAVIFERFSQVDDSMKRRAEGTGIGLNFSRELAELMGGTLTVVSQLGKGSTFTLLLPRWQQQVSASVLGTVAQGYEPLLPIGHLITGALVAKQQAGGRDAPLVLLVEDNDDIIAYVQLCLGSGFRTLTASNGQEGVDLAREHIPDIILSDVMMPVMDGLELCQTLKKDERTSHVPIILLTALGSLNNRIKGLRTGADVYLSKPFSREELLVQIDNLLAGRRRLQTFFTSLNPPVISSEENEAEADYQRVENEFLSKLSAMIEARLDDPKLRTEDLAQTVQLSQSQLWRKVKAVTGLSTNEFINRYRMQRAVEFMKAGNLSVAEVAYCVGFSDPSYFSKRFSKEYGTTPSDYLKGG